VLSDWLRLGVLIINATLLRVQLCSDLGWVNGKLQLHMSGALVYNRLRRPAIGTLELLTGDATM
jgi:hypothetical protein